MNRRQALAAVGGAGLGGLLVACGGDDDGGSAASSTTTSTTAGSGSSTTGTSGASALAGRFEDAASCTVTPEQTEGPYYFDVDSMRSDIREDREGATLRVGVRVLDPDCQPLPDAVVEVWHCDALGNYSGFEQASQGGPGGGRTDDETYLRGAQVTDSNGIVEFVTVYPGWYRGRTIHIHAKVHLSNTELLTTQMYFDDDFSAQVFQAEPYASDTGRDTFNDNDSIFAASNLMTLSQEGDVYLGLLNIDVDQA
jgi:protocatechuate 3,4-dioxygenase beta subunit